MNRFNFPRRCRLTIRPALLAPPALAAAIAWSSVAAANGWEHATVPFETLVKALNFEGPATRARAAASLGYREQPVAVEPLLKRLAKTESNRTVRRRSPKSSTRPDAKTMLGKIRTVPQFHEN